MNRYELSATCNDDLIENPVPRCACMLVLDTSGSMEGAPIEALNEGVRNFIASVQQDEVARYSVEIGVITFGGHVREQSPITPSHEISGIASLNSSGTTPMGQAVKLALQRLEERKQQYKQTGTSYYQPWLVIISDGAPTDSGWEAAALQTTQLDQGKKLVVLPVGVGDGANMGILSCFSSRGAKQLDGLKFNAFFHWLSASMSRVSASTPGCDVKIPSTSGWDTI